MPPLPLPDLFPELSPGSLMADGGAPAGYREFAECRLAADLAEVAPFLAHLRAWCLVRGMRDDHWQHLELAIAEAANNAIEHGSLHHDGAIPSGATILARWTWENGLFTIALLDRGSYCPPQFGGSDGGQLPDDPLDEGGRGAFLIRTLTDHQEHRLVGGHHCLLLAKRTGPARPPSETFLETETTLEEMSEDLSSSYESVSAMFQFGEDLATTPDLKNFVQKALDRLLNLVQGGSAHVRLAGKDHTLELYHQTGDAPIPRSIPLSSSGLEAKAFTQNQPQTAEHCEHLPPSDPLHTQEGSASALPICFQDHIIGTLAVLCPPLSTFFTAGQLSLIRLVAEFFGIAFTTSHLQEERKAQQLIVRELEIARDIQLSLLPRKFPDLSNIRIHGVCHSAQKVGGDFYDVMEMKDNSGVLLVIADVMGKGLPAALLATIFRTAVHSLRHLGVHPQWLMREVNAQLVNDLNNLEVFITAQMAYYSYDTHTLTLANAGHCPILRLPADGGPTQRLDAEGIPLGIMAGFDYTPCSFALEPGDRLIFLTDGTYEVTNSANEMLDLDSVISIMPGCWHESGEQFCETFLAWIDEFEGDAPAADDRTLLTVELLRPAT